MTTQEIKLEANKLFSENKYSEAFEVLILAGGDGLISSLLKSYKSPKSVLERHLSRLDALDFFWQTFVTSTTGFRSLFGTHSASHLLHLFFQQEVQNQTLIIMLAEQFPDLLISTIRLNAVFLDEKYYGELMELTFLDEVHKKHQELWKFLRARELELWEKVSVFWNDTQTISMEALLLEIVMWCEKTQLENGIGDVDVAHRLAEVYSILVSMLLSERNCDLDLDERVLDTAYREILNTKCIDHKVLYLAELILNWLNFKNSFLDLYCYDESYQIKKDGIYWVLACTSIDYYKWKLNGYRYPINQLSYFGNGIALVEELVEGGRIKIPIGKELGDEEVNYKLACDKYASLLFLDDLCVNDFIVGDQQINAQNAATHLVGFSTNKFVRNEVLKFQMQTIGSAFEIWEQIKLIEEHDGKMRRPYVLETIDSFIDMLCRCEQNLFKDEAVGIQRLITHIGRNSRRFDRFQIHYNVMLNPFIKTGNSLFTPALFLGNNSWFYSLAQDALLNNKRDKDLNETRTQEEFLGELFQIHFKVSVCNEEKPILIKRIGRGDVDIVAFDGNTLLLIQLKRTYFRTTTKETHFEQKVVDEKARQQLNEIEQTVLSDPKAFFKIFGLPFDSKTDFKIKKWYVSNSFENVGLKIDDCMKVNYFDVIRGLKYKKQWTSIGDFVSFVEREQYYLKIAFESPQETKDLFCISLPMQMPDAKDYTIPLIFQDSELPENGMWNRAKSAYDSGNNVIALEYYLEYLQINKTSGEAWGAVGNVYANMRDYNKAEHAFLMAIELSPRCPFVKHNYAYFLLQEKLDYLPALKMLLELYEEYPLCGFMHQDIAQSLKYFELTGLISTLAFEQVMKKWQSINKV